MKSEIGYHGGQRHERHTRRASRLLFFASFIFVFRPFPIVRLQDHPLRELLRILKRAGRFFCFFEGTDEGEEGRFMAVAFGGYRLTRAAK